MILNRLGNKTKIAADIIKYFPPHTLYVEPFFGAGGMFFNKPKAKYNILNDLDDDVFNLFDVLIKRKDELHEIAYKMPVHQSLWHYWRKNKESDPLLKACRFLLLSNFGYMGKAETLRFSNGNQKDILIEYIDKTYNYIYNSEFMCLSFEQVIKSIPKEDRLSNKTFIYCDPPYLNTTNNYQHSFTEEDSYKLFECLANGNKFNYAMSEFDHPFILKQAKERGLNIITIGDRINMKNRRTEILVTNYQLNTLF